MSKQVAIRRGSAANHQNFTGAQGEITVDTTNYRLILHDSTTAGGITGVKRTDVFNNGYPTLVDVLGQDRFASSTTQTEMLGVGGFGRFHIDTVDIYIQDVSEATPLLAHSGSVLLGQATRLSTSTNGFPYIPLITGVPTTNPQTNAGFCPIAINTGNMRLYIHNSTGKWWFTSLTST